MRFFYSLTATLAILCSSCSLVNPSDGLVTLWSRADTEGTGDLPLGDLGATDGDAFYAMRRRVAGVRQLASYNRSTGRLLWSSDVLGVCEPVIVRSGRVFCPAASVQAYDASTGRLLWRRSDPSDSSFSLVEGTADATRVFAATLTSISALDAVTGAKQWRRSLSGDGWAGIRLRSLTLSPEGDLLVALEAEFVQGAIFSAAVVVALDPATGQERWRYTDGDATTNRRAAGLTLWEDLVLYTDATGGEAVAFSRTTREVVWRRPWTPGFLGVLRPPLVADGVAYVSSGDGKLYAMDARTGAPRWTVAPTQTGYVSHEVCGPYLLGVTGGLVVVRRSDGGFQGRRFANERIGQIAVADNVAYVSTERAVYALACE